MKRARHVEPSDGGCWYCCTDDPPLAFCCAFDTYIHVACIESHLYGLTDAERRANGELLLIVREFAPLLPPDLVTWLPTVVPS